MGELFYNKLASRSSATGAGTNAGVTVTVAGVAGYKMAPLGIQVSGDAAALVTIESPSGTILWDERFTAAFTKEVAFPPGTVMGASGASLLLKISASTTHCEGTIEYGQMQG